MNAHDNATTPECGSTAMIFQMLPCWLVRLTKVGAAGAAFFGLAGLLSHVPGPPLYNLALIGFAHNSPTCSAGLILLGCILITSTQRSLSKFSYNLYCLTAALIASYGALKLAGVDFTFEHSCAIQGHERYGVPLAWTSPFASALLFISGAAVAAAVIFKKSRRATMAHSAGCLGAFVFITSSSFFIWHLAEGTTFRDQGVALHLAPTVALSFMMLGVALIGAAGLEAAPLCLIIGAVKTGQHMNARRRFVALALLMIAACGVAVAVTAALLYRHNLNEHRAQLTATVQSQARLIEAVARYDAGMASFIQDEYPDHDPTTATLGQIIDAHKRYVGFGRSGEFTLARQSGDYIAFILRHRHGALEHPPPIPLNSNLAEPMRRALRGLSGTVIGLDYRGAMVLAAHEPVAFLNLGIVAKIDMDEIRAPFIKAGLSASLISLVVVLAGTAIFFRIANPLIARLENQALDLQKEIDERTHAEEALRKSEATLREAQHMARLGNWYWSVHTGEVEWSEEVYNIFRLNPEEFTPQIDSIQALSPWPEEHQRDTELIQRAVESREQGSYEQRFLFPDGSTGYYFSTFQGIYDENGDLQAIKGTVQDITERKQAEAVREELETQLRQSQKMEAIGQLAGGVAHDFNNNLTAILGNVELSMDAVHSELGPDHDLAGSIEQIEKAARRAAMLTRQLLTFSRRDVVQPQILDLNRIIEDVDRMLRRLITENIVLKTVPAPNLRSVHADPGQMEQIIVNLVVNAVHAMPDGGQLTLETQNVVIDEHYASLHAEASPGPHVLLAVSDTGHGMDAETLERIFEPFFTTKPIDKGAGLGLATVHGIVKQSGGHIMAYSEPERGTTFKIFLPATDAPALSQISDSGDKATLRGQATILLCEDDIPVCRLTGASLNAAGYTVITASDGNEGIEAARRHDGNIDLLITDVIMPDMNGRQCAERLREIIPGLPALYISGYTSNVIAHHGVLDEAVEFLEKPFTRHELLTKVRDILAKVRVET